MTVEGYARVIIDKKDKIIEQLEKEIERHQKNANIAIKKCMKKTSV